jgi:hypothetical protein
MFDAAQQSIGVQQAERLALLLLLLLFRAGSVLLQLAATSGAATHL